jgi:hypothetical protein
MAKKKAPGRPLKKITEKLVPISFRVDPNVLKALQSRVKGQINSAGGKKSVNDLAREILVDAVKRQHVAEKDADEDA